MDKLYFFCAVFGSLFVLAQFFLTLFAGFGAEDAGDFEDAFGGTDGMDGTSGVDSTDIAGTSVLDPSQNGQTGESGSGIPFIKLLSIRTVTAGIAFFGLAGMAGLKGGLGAGVTFAVASVCGLTALILVYSLYKFISSFRYNGAVNSSSLPGSEGNVYVRIPPKRSGSGKVIVNHQGRSMEYDALSDEENELASGLPIVVKKVLSSTQVLVAPTDK